LNKNNFFSNSSKNILLSHTKTLNTKQKSYHGKIEKRKLKRRLKFPGQLKKSDY